VLAEEPHPVSLYHQRRVIVQDLAQKDQLVDVVGDGRVTLPVAVVGGDQPHRPHSVAGLFADLAHGCLGGTLSDAGPAARQRPAAVVWLLDEQYPAAVPEHRCPHVHLGRRGTSLDLEQPASPLEVPGRMGCEDLRGYLPKLLVTADVVIVRRVSEPVLGYGLQPFDPPEPLDVHVVTACRVRRGLACTLGTGGRFLPPYASVKVEARGRLWLSERCPPDG